MSSGMEFYLAAIAGGDLLGLSKGGFAGLGSLAMPMMSLVISPVRAAAIMLPHPHRPGLGERLGVPPRLFAAEPR